MEGFLVDDDRLCVNRFATVPLQGVFGVLWANRFYDYANCVRIPNRIVWCVAWQQKHIAFFDNYILEFTLVNDPQQHCSLMLVKPFFGFIDVVVIAFVRTTDSHDYEVFLLVQTEIVHRRLKEMAISLQPLWEVDGREKGHMVRW